MGFKSKFILFMLCSVSLSIPRANASGGISGGGVPETPFQHDRAAIQTILNNDDVLDLLQDKGKIIEVSAIDRTREVYRVWTEKCDLRVKFVRTCVVKNGLPQCIYGSTVLLNESVGDCAPQP
jgi:hypothetical protein